MEDAKSILARWSVMEGDRKPWDSHWQDVADYSMPRKGKVGGVQTSQPGDNTANRLYDVTAIHGTQTLANGHSSHITPAGTRWFAWEAPDDIKSETADAWYAEASETTAKILASGNFYPALNEAFLERSGFGIACIDAMEDKVSKIKFQAHPVGTYCIEEDAEGNVDTVFRCAGYGIRQLVQMFGEQKIAADKKLAKAWEQYQKNGNNSFHQVIHAVFPRINREIGKADVFNMRYASVWVAVEGKSVLQRSGFQELPYCVTRYLKRPGTGQQYGYGPFEEVKAAVIDANATKEILQVVGQKLAVPPVLIPDNLVGNVDARPGGRTVFKSGANAGELPREWLHQGRPDGMLEQLQDARETINRAYHVDLFRMFSELDKVMTAREVSERSAEKLMQFSPSFTRFVADFQVLMNRIFSILLRSGAFGKLAEIPPEVVRMTTEGPEVPNPKVIYQSRIALAIRQAESAASDRSIERALSISQMLPEAMDNIDVDAYVRQTARNEGAPESLLVKEEVRDERRKKRAEAQAKQAEMQQAEMLAATAGNLGVKA